MSIFKKTQLKNVAEAVINPATKENQDTLIQKITDVTLNDTIQVGGTLDTVTSLPLPSGASTSSNQTSGAQKTQVTDSSGNVAAIVTGPFTGEKGLRVYGGPTDPVSDIPVFIDFEHHQVHEGETFRAQSLALSATTMFRFSVPAGYSPTIQAPHLIVSTAVYGGTLRMELFEGFTGIPTPGTALLIRNRNRNYSAPSPATVSIHPVTGTLTGTTLLETTIIAAGERSTDTRAGAEWILKPGTDYLIVATEVAAFTDTFVHFDYYEDKGV